MLIYYNPITNIGVDPETGRASTPQAYDAKKRKPPSGNLAGAPGAYYDATYGGIPFVASPGEATKVATQAGQEALPGLTTLGSDITDANQQQLIGQYVRGLPEYQSMLNQSSANISSALRGELPQDVQDLIWQQAAERGVAQGVPGSQFANYGGLRTLGLTSLGRMDQGEQLLTGAIGRTPTAKPFDISGWMASPGQFEAAQNQANLYSSAPIPAYAGQANMAAVNAGLNRGYNAGSSGYGNLANYNANQSPNQADQLAMVQSIIDRYTKAQGGSSSQAPPTTTTTPAPSSPGWGYVTNDRGYYSTGDVPPDRVPAEFRNYSSPGGEYSYKNYYPEDSMY